MSSEKTGNLGLHKWAPTDGVLRTEFNDNFGKIDEKVAEIGDVLGDSTLIAQPTIVEAITEVSGGVANLNNILGNESIASRLLYKGAAIPNFMNVTYPPIVESLKQDNCDIQVMQRVSMPSGTSSTVERRVDDDLFIILNSCVEKGVKIPMFKIHATVGYDDGFPKESILPSDLSTWFANYQTQLMHYGQIASNYNIPIFCISNELKSMTTTEFTPHWKTLIDAVRAAFPSMKIAVSFKYSELTRALEEKEKGLPNLIDHIDIIGANIYPRMTTKVLVNNNITVDELKKGIHLNIDGVRYVNTVSELYRVYKKDIIITETGIMPKDDALIYPTGATGNPNDQVQSLYYRTVLDVFGSMHQIKGIFIWAAREPFDFIGREGELVLREIFGGGSV